MHAYPDCVFLVLHGPQRGERGHVHFLELDQFIGANFLVTVHGPLNPASAASREIRSVLSRIETGRLRPAGPAELSHAIVAALTRRQEEYVEQVTADGWRLEQQVTGGEVGNPEEFLNELLRARHGLLTVRTMSAHSSSIYQRVAGLPVIGDGDQALFADVADRFVRVRRSADDEREYLQGVLEPHMSELGRQWGYPFALLLMLLASVGLHRIFRYKGWL